MREKKIDDSNLEVNLGSLTILEKQYNFEDFNNLEQIEKIDDHDHLTEETQVISNYNNNKKTQNMEDQININFEDFLHEPEVENNINEDDKIFKQKLVIWLKDDDLKLLPKFPLSLTNSSNDVIDGNSGNTDQGPLGDMGNP